MKKQTARMTPFARRKVLELVARGLAIFMLGIWLTQVIPGATHRAYAAPLEDCDLDGFDDATGVAVPWPGYDETHGDTSAGPGTADWWVKQNQSSGSTGSNSGSGSSGSGSSSSGSGSSSSGSGTSKNSGSSTTSSGSKRSGSSGGSGSTSTNSGNEQTTSGAEKTVNAPTTASASTATSLTASTATAAASFSTTAGASRESSSDVATQGIAGTGANAATSDNLWSALTVGFTGENDELLAGLSLLAALAIAGVVATGWSSFVGLRSEP